ncbi:MAG: RecX family transcriptional regulator [Candidatus Omnitrophica bacterium]|nr:RecX family transcriptional regulator [Candidatus Omnitrophota bacterium]
MQEEYKKALQYSFLLLKYRDRTTFELKTRLRRKKFSKSVVEKTVEYLVENRYVNDRDFAFLYARQKFRDAFGERKVAFELKRFGIDHETIRQAVTAARGEFDKTDMIKTLIEKKCRDKTPRAIMRYLVQRGFQYEDIMQGLTDED